MVRFIEENTKLVEKETGNKSNNDVTTTKKKALQDIIINNGVGLINSWVDSMRACSPTHLKSLLKQSSWLTEHPSALDMFEEILHLSEGKQIVMFLDYDGTLSPIVDDPDRAFMSRKMRRTVRKLANCFPTAIVSGRCIEKVYNFVKLTELYYAGSHGMDIKGPEQGSKYEQILQDSKSLLCQPATEFLPMIDEVYHKLVEKTKLNEHAKLSMLRNATWTLSNFCRGKPQPPFDQVRPALPALERLIHSTDEEVLTDACWALSYLSDGTNDKIQSVIEAGVVPRLVELLQHQSPSVLIPALRSIGNIVTGDDLQTQCVISHGALLSLLSLLTHNHKKSIKKEACWTISNITAGNRDQIQAVCEAGLICPLVNLLQNAEFDIKKEAAWAISNATSGGSPDQIKYMVEQGVVKPLCDLLVCPDPRIITVCLEGLENILKVGEAEKVTGNTGDVNFYAQLIDDAEGLEKIENLQSHDNSEIYEKAVKILETYWLEEEDETLPPGDPSAQGFQFGGGNDAAVPPGGFNFQ